MPYLAVSAFASNPEWGTLLVQPNMTSLAEFLRQHVAAEKFFWEGLSETYIKELEQCMKTDVILGLEQAVGYDYAIRRMFHFLRGEKFDG